MPLLIAGGTVTRQHNLKGCMGRKCEPETDKKSPWYCQICRHKKRPATPKNHWSDYAHNIDTQLSCFTFLYKYNYSHSCNCHHNIYCDWCHITSLWWCSCFIYRWCVLICWYSSISRWCIIIWCRNISIIRWTTIVRSISIIRWATIVRSTTIISLCIIVAW